MIKNEEDIIVGQKRTLYCLEPLIEIQC